jgi:hypothetical protein
VLSGFRVVPGGQSGFATSDGFGGGITATGNSRPFVNTDAIFELLELRRYRCDWWCVEFSKHHDYHSAHIGGRLTW